MLAGYNKVTKRKAVSNMKRWVKIMSALVFGAGLLYMAPSFGEAAPAPAGDIRHESAVEYKHAHHNRRPPARHVGHHNDHHRGPHHDNHHNRHHNYRHDHRNPHVREIHHRPHHDIRHDRHYHGRNAESVGNVTITLAKDV